MDLIHIFVPKAVVAKHKIDALEFGFAEPEVVADIEGLSCVGHTAMLKEEVLKQMLLRWKLRAIPNERAIVGDSVFDVARAECDSYISLPSYHPAQEKIDAFMEEISLTIETFGSRLGLSEVGLHFMVDPKDIYPARTDRANKLTLVVGGGPVGLVNNQLVSTLCGVLLTEDGDKVPLRSHSGGYGGLVKDDEDVVIAQIVESVFYLNIPSKQERFATHFSGMGSDLFRKLLYMLWNRQKNATPPAVRTVVEDPETYVEQMLAHEKMNVGAYRLMADASRKKIARLERDLRLEILNAANLDRISTNLKAYTKLPGRADKLRASFERLKRHRLMEKIVTTGDEFFEVWTKPVFIEHDSNTYGPFGPYVITVYRETGILIRCQGSPHKGMYVHPHVPVETSEPCFGNATRAIGEALANDDRTLGIELILEWLESGYDHSIAEFKIGNWPVVSSESEPKLESANAG